LACADAVSQVLNGLGSFFSVGHGKDNGGSSADDVRRRRIRQAGWSCVVIHEDVALAVQFQFGTGGG